jgi:hypothetical protein
MGRPLLPPGQRRINASITINPVTMEALLHIRKNGSEQLSLSRIVEKALEAHYVQPLREEGKLSDGTTSDP